MSAVVNPRVIAARVVAAVMAGKGKNLDDALARADTRGVSSQQLSLLKAMAYGVVREHLLLSELLQKMLEHPLKNEPELHALFLIGLYQLRSMRVAPHAAVSETVNAVEALGKPKLRGLANAVLRRYQRESEVLEASLPQRPEIRWSYPNWLAEQILADWPEQGEAILAAGNVQGPLTLRVNRRLTTRDAYLETLAAAGIAAQALSAAADAVLLESALGVEDIPGFAQGEVSVQDAAAQLAADVLDVLDAQPGMRVLDACAAPGGKSAHLLERNPDLHLIALDRDAARLQRAQATFARLHLTPMPTLIPADALDPQRWFDGQPFDRILVDAPCSGTGVIRRHPDIKWLRRETDIPKLAAQQKGMLSALWPLLNSGGVLVYATCSILKSEGEQVAKHFLITHPDAKHVPIAPDWGEPCNVGRRIAPGGPFDGFYYARFAKR